MPVPSKGLSLMVVVLVLAALPVRAQTPANLKLQTFDFEPDLRASIIRDPAPGVLLSLNQRDPRGTGRFTVLSKKRIASAFVVTAGFEVTSENACIGGLWLADKTSQPNAVFFGVQPSLDRRRLLMFNGTPIPVDLMPPSSFVGGMAWERVEESATARAYSISADGISWTQILTEPSNVRTRRYGLAVQNRNGTPAAPDCELKIYSFKEEKL